MSVTGNHSNQSGVYYLADLDPSPQHLMLTLRVVPCSTAMLLPLAQGQQLIKGCCMCLSPSEIHRSIGHRTWGKIWNHLSVFTGTFHLGMIQVEPPP